MAEKKTVLYYFIGSMPSRACLILTKILDIPIELKVVNILEGEQHSDWYKKITPAKKVPVLVDGEFVLTESRAILAYLVDTRKPGSSLYPKDEKKRAKINERLYFDGATLFPKISNVVISKMMGKSEEEISQAKKELATVLKVLEQFLSKSEFFAGNEMTIADVSFLPNITTVVDFGINLSKYPKLYSWYQKMQKIPGNDFNISGSKVIREFMGLNSKL